MLLEDERLCSRLRQKAAQSFYVVRFQVHTAAGMMFRIVFWDILPCKMIVIPDDGGSTHL
jgi:hypothetical protein